MATYTNVSQVVPPKKTTDSSQIRDIFVELMTKLEFEHGRKNLSYPETIVFVVGPSKSGKTTLSLLLSEMLGFRNDPIPLRSLCRSVITMNGGKFQIDLIVEKLVTELFNQKDKTGVIIDDFVSTSCARLLPFLYEYLDLLASVNGLPKPKFKFCILYANQRTVLERRKLAGVQDGMPEAKFVQLFRKFYKRTQQVVEILNMYFRFNIINCNGTLSETKEIAMGEMHSELNGSKNDFANLSDLLSSKPTVAVNREYQDKMLETEDKTDEHRRRAMRASHEAAMRKIKAMQTLEREQFLRAQSMNYATSPYPNRPSMPSRSLSIGGMSMNRPLSATQHVSVDYMMENPVYLNFRAPEFQPASARPKQVAQPQRDFPPVRKSRPLLTRTYTTRKPKQAKSADRSVNQLDNNSNEVDVENFIEVFIRNNVNDFANNTEVLSKHDAISEIEKLKKILQQNTYKINGVISQPITLSDEKNIVKDMTCVMPIIVGQKCLIQWNQAGECFLVDYHMNYYKYNPFENEALQGTIIDGVVAFTKKRIVFVINDVAMYNNKNCVVRSLTERLEHAEKIPKILTADNQNGENNRILVTKNIFVPIKKSFKFSELVKKGKCRIHGSPRCSGFAMIPINSKFYCSSKKKAYTWALSDTEISFQDMKSLIKNIQRQ